MRKMPTLLSFGAALTVALTLSAQGPPAAGPPPAGRGGGFSSGPNDKQIVDAALAAQGKSIYIAECINCHGPKARGNDNGADLIRSVTVLHDRYGSVLGPFLAKNHPLQSGKASSTLSADQVLKLSHFLKERVNDTLRGGPYSQVINVLTGDAKAGQAYFEGAGKCASCHSPAGDFAGIASRYDPTTLQQRFLFPFPGGRGGRGAPVANVPQAKPVRVTITPPTGPTISGILDRMDDFNVTIRDEAGSLQTIRRIAGLKVTKNDPYAAHAAMLKVYTDKDIHDVVAYLETLR